MSPLRAALAAAGVAAALLTTAAPAVAAGPSTYGITPSKGTASTGITATFSFKTASAGACTAQQVRFFWDGAYWGSAPTTWIAGNGTCTGDATLRPPSGATPGVHQTTAADSSGLESSTTPALFLLLNPDGSQPTPTPAAAPGTGGGDPGTGGAPLVPIILVGVVAAAAAGSALAVGRVRRRPGAGRRRP